VFLLPKDARKYLSGLIISGSQAISDSSIVLYTNNTNVPACTNGMFRSYGDHACDDVILIPVTSEQHVRYVTILTYTVVTTCEVQIFAGKMLYFALVYLCNIQIKQCPWLSLFPYFLQTYIVLLHDLFVFVLFDTKWVVRCLDV